MKITVQVNVPEGVYCRCDSEYDCQHLYGSSSGGVFCNLFSVYTPWHNNEVLKCLSCLKACERAKEGERDGNNT